MFCQFFMRIEIGKANRVATRSALSTFVRKARSAAAVVVMACFTLCRTASRNTFIPLPFRLYHPRIVCLSQNFNIFSACPLFIHLFINSFICFVYFAFCYNPKTKSTNNLLCLTIHFPKLIRSTKRFRR